MSTPNFDTICTLCDVLAEFSWVYEFKVTQFFIEQVWKNFSSEWNSFMLSLTAEGLNGLPFANELKSEIPNSLLRLILLANQQSTPREPIGPQPCLRLDNSLRRGMKSKKEHEVAIMANTVAMLCEDCHLRHVVDVGSGLGYLGRVLYSELGYHVLGLEAAQSRSYRAVQQCSQHQARKKQVAAGGSFTSIPLTLATDDVERVREVISSWVDQCNIADGNSNSKDTIQKTFHVNFCARTDVHLLSEEGPHNNSQISSSSQFDANCSQTLFTSKQDTTDISVLVDCDKVHVLESELACKPSAVCARSDDSHLVAPTSSCDKVISVADQLLVDQRNSKCHLNNASTYVGVGSEMECPKTAACKCDAWLADGQSGDEESQRCVCMVGLHCCGDLVPIMLRQFCALQEIKVLLCFSCCYHKMSLTEGKYAQFPMSVQVTSAIQNAQLKYPQWKGLTAFGMRLAAQETRLRWANQSAEDHEQHARNVAYRAVIESYWDGSESSTSRSRLRRPVSQRNNCNDFGDYLESISFDGDRSKVWSLYHELQPYFKFIEPITCLQVIMQPLVEGLILMDRKLYLEEAGYRADLKQLFDDVISPRSVALIAYKH